MDAQAAVRRGEWRSEADYNHRLVKQAAAEWHAAERARLTALGKTPPFADGQIMAIARANSLTLVTLNPSDYAAFSEVMVEDWSR